MNYSVVPTSQFYCLTNSQSVGLNHCSKEPFVREWYISSLTIDQSKGISVKVTRGTSWTSKITFLQSLEVHNEMLKLCLS